MKSRTVTIRFYPDREADRAALDWLDRKEYAGFKSNNAAVVTAINDYFSRRERESESRAREEAFLQKVLDTIQQGLRESGAANLGGLVTLLQSATPTPHRIEDEKSVDEESLAAALDFADSL